ncbi:Target of rapamycin complex 1 subunit kog1, partial [Coemansia sp. RSA 1972]
MAPGCSNTGSTNDTFKHLAVPNLAPQLVTTANGIEVDMHELIGDYSPTASMRHNGQTHMEERADFHTHPRSLALARMQLDNWRPRHTSTASALLAVCLDLTSAKYSPGQTTHCAIMEAWTDPTTSNVSQMYSTISDNLVSQFEQLPGKIIYKPLIDCDVLRLQRNSLHFRNVAKDQRILFYYNGHGMPHPTDDGCFWAFKPRNGYTCRDVVPVKAETMISWLGSPSLYIWDCAHAMNIVHAFERHHTSRDKEIDRIRSIAHVAQIGTLPDNYTSEQMDAACAQVAQLMSQPANSQHIVHNMELIKLALLPPQPSTIHFAATQSHETLPTNADLPADLFTACMTTPVKAAVRFWLHTHPHAKVTQEMSDQIPGSLKDRSTPLGELCWTLTAITDTIAWCTLPRPLFHTLFRQDATVASLFRNFILASRIMRHYNVSPQSRPNIPSSHTHLLWESLDYEIDMCLKQLPRLLKEQHRQKQRMDRVKRSEEERRIRANKRKQKMETCNIEELLNNINTLKFSGSYKIPLEIASSFNPWSSRHVRRLSIYESEESESESSSDSDGAGNMRHSQNTVDTEYVPSSFFVNQLRAFEIWLQQAAASMALFSADQSATLLPASASTCVPSFLEPPEQLPIMLQLILSQTHRLSVLVLLYRFVNLGPWAANMALHVGFFTYLTKLLSSATVEIQELSILIWARLIAIDPSLSNDLMKEDGAQCLIAYLMKTSQARDLNSSEKTRMSDSIVSACAFICTTVCQYSPDAQHVFAENNLLCCLVKLLYRLDNGTDEQACSRTWIIMCLAELWNANPNIKQHAISFGAQNASNSQKLYTASILEHVCGTQDLLIYMALHRTPLVRAASVYALGTLIKDLSLLNNSDMQTTVLNVERQVYALLLQAASDASPLVRREVVCVIGSSVFASYMPQAIEAVSRVIGKELREHRRISLQMDSNMAIEITQEMMVRLYKVLLKLSTDGHPDVMFIARGACDILLQCYVHSQSVLAQDVTLRCLHDKISRQPTLGSPLIYGSSLDPATPVNLSKLMSANASMANIGQQIQLGNSECIQTTEQSHAEHVELMHKYGEVEQLWLEWGRHELRETVCASTLLDWAGAHFTEFDILLFDNVSVPLQSSASLVESRERNRCMDHMEQDARILSSQAGIMKWVDVRAVASMKEPATVAIMHPLESHAVVASSRGTVSVFDWEAQAQVGHYSIGSCGNFSEAMSISSLHLINPLGQAKLLASTQDGKVRIFASHAPDFVSPSGTQAPVFPRPRLLTAFTALPWASPSINVGYGYGQSMPSASTVGQNQRLKAHQQSLAPTLSVNNAGLDSGLSGALLNEPEGCGLVTAWNQRSGILFAGGNDKEVRIWDITSEMCVEEIAVASMGGITCISHDSGSGNIFAVGNTNGLVRVMDRRMDARTGTVANWREHTPSKICNVFIRPGQAEVVSASENGDIKYWDLRHHKSVFTLADTHPDHMLQYMVAHESTPVVMTASSVTVKFWNQHGSSIGAVQVNQSVLGAASYMKTLAGYGTSRTQTVRVTAAALHGYLPVAVVVSDDGR